MEGSRGEKLRLEKELKMDVRKLIRKSQSRSQRSQIVAEMTREDMRLSDDENGSRKWL